MDAIKTWKERAAEHKTGLLRLPPQPEYFMAEEIADLRAALAIAPPVAAGSVESLDKVLGGFLTPDGVIFGDIIAWGAQQREAGRLDEAARIRHLTYERDQFRTAQGVALNAVADLRQRAEKAEARVAELMKKR